MTGRPGLSGSVQAPDAWANSAVLAGELTAEVSRLRAERDVIVIGSTSVVHALMRDDLVDEYRLPVFPTVLGAGRRLFDGTVGALDLVSVERSGPAALMAYERAR